MARRFAYTEIRFSLAYGFLAAVGLGSAAFHCSLRSHAQMLDELPMLYANLVFLFLLFEVWCASFSLSSVCCRTPTQNRVIDGCALFVCGSVLTVVYVLFPQLYSIFLTSTLSLCLLCHSVVLRAAYTSIVAFVIIISIYRQTTMASLAAQVQHPEKAAAVRLSRRLLIASVSLYLLGSVLWAFEQIVCSPKQPEAEQRKGQYHSLLQTVQLHAWWHLLAGLATHTWIQARNPVFQQLIHIFLQFITVVRAVALRDAHQLRCDCSTAALPYVVVVTSKQK